MPQRSESPLTELSRLLLISQDQVASDLGDLACTWEGILVIIPYPTRAVAVKLITALVYLYCRLRNLQPRQFNKAGPIVIQSVGLLVLEPDSPWKGRLPKLQSLFPSENALAKTAVEGEGGGKGGWEFKP